MPTSRVLCLVVVCVVYVGCAKQAAKPAVVNPAVAPTPAPAKPRGVAPAGWCGIAAYISSTKACQAAPTPAYAVAFGVYERVDAVEGALRRGRELKLPVGYPLGFSLDELRVTDAKLRGMVAVLGLFVAQSDAEAFLAQLPSDARLLELSKSGLVANWSPAAKGTQRFTVVQVVSRARAWSKAALDKIEAELSRLKWLPWAEATARRRKALDKLLPRCVVERGRVFSVLQNRIFRFSRTYAPVRCADGREAWVRWQATALESVVVPTTDGAVEYQVVAVSCDTPLIEKRLRQRDRTKLVASISLGSCGD